MDSKDASSGLSVTVTDHKDDDVEVTVTAREASEAFEHGRLDECADKLNQLLLKTNDDPKVLHNVAILEYFKDGCSDLKKLLKDFENFKKQSDKPAHASGEHADSVGNMGSKAVSAVKGANSVPHQFSSSNGSNFERGDGYDTFFMMFNTAVIWFSLHEYVKAYSLLDSLYKKIEPVDKETAVRVCLLFLDVALTTPDPRKFLDVIAYVEKACCDSNPSGQGDHGISMQGSSNLMTKSSSLPSNTAVADASNPDLVANANALEGALSIAMSEENIETLISTFDMSRHNTTRQCVLQSANDYTRTPTDQSISPTDLKLQLQLCKVQYLLLTRNLKAAKREVKTAMPNQACGKDSSVALLLKSQLEYARGNYSKAIKLLMASSIRDERVKSIIHNNNLGCIYYRLRKYHTSAVFFSRALSVSSSLRKEKPLKMSTMSQDKSLQIIYNCGIQNLAIEKPILAASCFIKSSRVFYMRPLLWLRIAESCLMALDKGLLSSGETKNDGSDVKVHVNGEGKWRQLAIDNVGFGVKPNFDLGDDKQPMLSLPKARQCLWNALYLLDNLDSKPINPPPPPQSSTSEEIEITEAPPKISINRNVASGDSKTLNLKVSSGQINSNGDSKEQKSGNNPNATLQNSIVDYDNICKKENHMLRQALIADLAFVELELGNTVNALSAAKSLLELKELSKFYLFLGKIYAAESLCLLNRPMEAAEILLSYLSSENKFGLPYNEEDCEKWRVVKTFDCEDQIVRNSSPDDSQEVVFLKPEEALGTLYVNRAVLFVLVGNFEQARELAIEGLSKLPNSTEAIITAIFVDLAMGNTQAALAKLKKSSHIRYLSSKFPLKGSC